jgi:hypothetical protein
MFQTGIVENIETGILYSVTFSSKIVPFMKYVDKDGRAGQQATVYNMAHAQCMLDT